MYEVGSISKSLASTPASFCSDVSEVEDDHRGMSSFDSCTKQSARKPRCSVESHDDKIEKLCDVCYYLATKDLTVATILQTPIVVF
ncbi:hypothetical protein F2Q69_00042561 [Brassica cretica]|uniref:Uncharacterized protein n=1 Tax=Brassica cretica TaxID=69181 RepID=A0A8S9NN12_BRACR|nr:hypothetical protein F2Q69_00042561 [Brassica cretica]